MCWVSALVEVNKIHLSASRFRQVLYLDEVSVSYAGGRGGGGSTTYFITPTVSGPKSRMSVTTDYLLKLQSLWL